jgi:hypothetical protein
MPGSCSGVHACIVCLAAWGRHTNTSGPLGSPCVEYVFRAALHTLLNGQSLRALPGRKRGKCNHRPLPTAQHECRHDRCSSGLSCVCKTVRHAKYTGLPCMSTQTAPCKACRPHAAPTHSCGMRIPGSARHSAEQSALGSLQKRQGVISNCLNDVPLHQTILVTPANLSAATPSTRQLLHNHTSTGTIAAACAQLGQR